MNGCTPTTSPRRRGSAYVAILGVSLMLSVVGFSALIGVRVDRRATQAGSDFTQARLLAQSAIEMGIHHVGKDQAWRSARPNGTWESNRALTTGTYTLAGVDPNDGVLNNSNFDPLVLTGTGLAGVAAYKLSATLVAQEPPLGCLEVPLHAGNDLTFNSATVTADAATSANRSVDASNSTINAAVETVSTITGSTYNSTISPGGKPKSMPGGTVFDYYVTNGTPINYASIPGGRIENVVLSPSSNPYGAGTNANGIYVVSCAGSKITIQDARIFGTLVLLDVKGDSSVTKSVSWQPAVANYPSLLVRGKFNFDLDAIALDESILGVNLNPPGAAYKGVTNTTRTDTYPSKLEGLFYASSDVTVSKALTLKGVLVGGNNIAVNNAVTLTYDETFKTNPPPGFKEAPVMVLSASSYRQVVD